MIGIIEHPAKCESCSDVPASRRLRLQHKYPLCISDTHIQLRALLDLAQRQAFRAMARCHRARVFAHRCHDESLLWILRGSRALRERDTDTDIHSKGDRYEEHCKISCRWTGSVKPARRQCGLDADDARNRVCHGIPGCREQTCGQSRWPQGAAAKAACAASGAVRNSAAGPVRSQQPEQSPLGLARPACTACPVLVAPIPKAR
jgi:hypothetical protein